jgi:aspartyl-tRNA(Asn)/glutamyl-tRNA(Gln) amidotransferase subunit A
MDSIFYYQNPQTPAAEGGELSGLKIMVQPNLSAAGWPCDAGSKALSNYKALEDATIIRKLCQAGAALTGSSCMSEFGFGLQNSRAAEALRQKMEMPSWYGPDGEPRGSSKAPFAASSPATCLMSISGYRPDSIDGKLRDSPVIKIIRDVLKAVSGPDERDFAVPDGAAPDFSPPMINPPETCIGVLKEARQLLSPDQESMFASSLEELKKAGFSLREVCLPEFDLFSLVHNIAGSVEASSCAGRYDSVRYGQRAPGAKNWNDMYLQSRGAAFGTLVKSYLIQGAYFQFEKYDSFEDACRIRPG